MHQFTSKYKKIAENERNAQNQGKSGILAHISKIGHKSIYNKHHPCENRPTDTSKVCPKYVTFHYTISTTPAPGRPYFRAVAAKYINIQFT